MKSDVFPMGSYSQIVRPGRFAASSMKNDYGYRWDSIRSWLRLSLRPKSVEFNLLGFGKINKPNRMKTIQSPMKSKNDIEYCNRSSYVTHENDLSHQDKNLIVVFEATTAKIYFSADIL